LQCGKISPVPEAVASYASFRQVKPKGSKGKLTRRWAKRHGKELAEALSQYGGYEQKSSRLPYINMISQSNGHHFRMFIKKQEMKSPQTGLFSCYGLSNTTTVPLF
jgi:CRISPR-associated endonuclease Csy4